MGMLCTRSVYDGNVLTKEIVDASYQVLAVTDMFVKDSMLDEKKEKLLDPYEVIRSNFTGTNPVRFVFGKRMNLSFFYNLVLFEIQTNIESLTNIQYRQKLTEPSDHPIALFMRNESYSVSCDKTILHLKGLTQKCFVTASYNVVEMCMMNQILNCIGSENTIISKEHHQTIRVDAKRCNLNISG